MLDGEGGVNEMNRYKIRFKKFFFCHFLTVILALLMISSDFIVLADNPVLSIENDIPDTYQMSGAAESNTFRISQVSHLEDKEANETDSEKYNSTAGVHSIFSLREDSDIKAFSMYFIVPSGVTLNELYANSGELLDYVTFSSDTLTPGYIKAHTTVEIDKNFRDSGRTYIAMHFDFRSEPVKMSWIEIKNIPLYVENENRLSGILSDISCRMNFAMLMDENTENWTGSSIDNSNEENGLLRDIDGDGDTSEPASIHSVTINPGEVKRFPNDVHLTKSVKTELTGSYAVQGGAVSPQVYGNREYSYKLRMETPTGDTVYKDILFVDILEESSDWQGKLVGFDYSYVKNNLGVIPDIYYSTEEINTSSRPDLNNESTWKKWNDGESLENISVKSIAVHFKTQVYGSGTRDLELGSGRYLYIKVIMKSPELTNDNQYKKTTNNFKAFYNIQDGQQDNVRTSDNIDLWIVPYKGTIRIVKQDEIDGTYLEGAVFDMYESGSNRLIKSDITTDETGVTRFKATYGNYYLVETTAPKGYNLITNNINIAWNNTSVPNVVSEITVKDPRKDGLTTVKNISDRIDVTANYTQSNEIPVKGATLSLYKADGTFIKDLVFDNISEINEIAIPEWGEYYLKIKTAAQGYLKSEEKFSFTISAENDAGRELVVKVVHEQGHTSVTLTKYEENLVYGGNSNNIVPGATYELWLGGYGGYDRGRYTTDENGQITVENLTYGNYVFREHTAAEGYDIRNSDINFTLAPDHPIEVLTTDDKRLPGIVEIYKTDDKERNVEGSKFALFRSDDDVQVDITGQPSDIVFTTPATGVLTISEIYWGEYYIKEIEAPKGYQLDDTKHYFSIDKTTAGKTIRFDIGTKEGTGSVELTKVSQVEKDKTLPDAVFTLYKSDGSIYRDNLTTNEKGIIQVDGIEWGSYYFLEKEAPSGYGLNTNKIRFSVNNLTADKVQKLTVEDPANVYELTVTKSIKADETVFAHGNPRFIFRLDLVDNGTVKQTLYRTVTFSQEYFDLYKDKEGKESVEYVEQSVVFAELSAGTWRVTEESSLRYSKSDCFTVDLSGNETPVSGTPEYTLGDYNESAHVKFTSSKAIQSGMSSTALVSNIIKRERVLTAIVAIWKGAKVITTDTLDRDDLEVYAFYDDGTSVKLKNDQYDLIPDNFSGMVSGKTSVTVSYTEGSRTCQDSFDLELNLPVPFTWELKDGNEQYEENGKTYGGDVVITGYTGKAAAITFPGEVYGINTLKNNQGSVEFTDDGLYHKVVGVKTTMYNSSMYGINGTVEEITFSDSISSIADYTFTNCISLTGITFGENSQLEIIGNYAFFSCSGLPGTLTIPSNVTLIGGSAFRACTRLTGLEFGGNSQLEKIDNYAFNSCSNLTGTLTIPNNVILIGNNVFESCSSLIGLEFDENSRLEKIGDNAFHLCTGFTGELKIPSSVKSIGAYAFAGNRSGEDMYYAPQFTSLVFEENSQLTEIDTYAFAGCKQMKNQLILPSGLAKISDNAFRLCGFTGKLVIHKNINVIERSGFYGCSNLEDLEFEEGINLITIDNYAFYNCSSLKCKLEIPNSVTSIGDYSFYQCRSLTDLILGKNVQTIGNYAFRYCSNLSNDLIIPDSVISIGQYAFQNCESLTDLTLGTSIQTIGAYAFAQCSNLCNDLIIPDSVTTIAESAFYSCSKLTGLIIGQKVTTLANNAFSNCSSLKYLRFHDDINLTSIGQSAFRYCSGLTGTIKIPSSVKKLEYGAFYSCSSLVNVEIESEIVLEGQVFNGCTNLQTIDLHYATAIPTYEFYKCNNLLGENIEKTNDTNINPDKTYYTYDDSTGMYTKVSEPADSDIGTYYEVTKPITISNVVTSVGQYAFSSCTALETIVFGSGVTTLDVGLFSGCTSLKECTFNGVIKDIQWDAFNACGSLVKLTYASEPDGTIIPSSVTSINLRAFYNCVSLPGELKIPEGMTTINQDTFYYCQNLTSITIPSTLTSIGARAFEFCSSITMIDLSAAASLQTIGVSAFEACTPKAANYADGNLIVPYNVNTIGNYAFSFGNDTDVILQLPVKFSPNTYGYKTDYVTYYSP